MALVGTSTHYLWAATAKSTIQTATWNTHTFGDPIDVLVTVSMNQFTDVYFSWGEWAPNSHAGIWIVGWDDVNGWQPHSGGLQTAWIPKCKKVYFAVDVMNSIVYGYATINYYK